MAPKAAKKEVRPPVLCLLESIFPEWVDDGKAAPPEKELGEQCLQCARAVLA